MGSEQNLVTVITVSYHGETLRYDALLDGTGIFYTWTGAEAATLGPEASGIAAGIRLQVKAEDFEEVEAILKEAEADNESIERLATINFNGERYIHVDEYCPKCDNFGIYMEHGSMIKRLSQLGRKRKRHCTECMEEW